MGYAAAEALMRRKLLEAAYDRMTPEERRLFVRMTMERKSHREIMEALGRQQAQLDRLQRTQQTFYGGLMSNIAGNAVYGGALWLLRRLLG